MFALKSRRGAAGQQYAIVVGLVAVVAILAVTSAGSGLRSLMARTANTLSNVNGVQSSGGGGGGGGGPVPPTLPSSLSVPLTGGSFTSPAVAAATGGATITSLVLSSGSLPPGLSISGNTITGTALGGDGATVSLTATDSNGQSTTAPVFINIIDPHWSNTVALFRMDTGGAVDLKGGKALTRNNGASIVASPVYASPRSLALDGTSGTSLTAPASSDWSFGAGDFTLEAYIRTSATGERNIFNRSIAYGTSDSSFYMGLNSCGGGSMILQVTQSSGWDSGPCGGSGAANGAWNHIAWVRSGTTIRAFLNGTLQASSTLTGGYTVANSSRVLEVGAQNGAINFQGNIEEVRITKGIGRYTANFTPPTGLYPTD